MAREIVGVALLEVLDLTFKNGAKGVDRFLKAGSLNTTVLEWIAPAAHDVAESFPARRTVDRGFDGW